MDNERGTIGGLDLARWAVVATLVVAGVGLYFAFGRRTAPVIEPSVAEGSAEAPR